MLKSKIDTNEYTGSLIEAFLDFKNSLNMFNVWSYLSLQDIKQRYRRSVIGPFWITISNAIIIFMLSLLYGTLFGLPLEIYAPYLAVGMLVWNFISITLNESINIFFENINIIKQVNNPINFYIFRLVGRNIIVFLHNFIIIPPILYIFNIELNLIDMLSAILALFILTLNVSLLSLIVAISCVRYRDVGPLISNLLQAIFFVSPIMWLPSVLEGRGVASWILTLNPIFYQIEMVRSPLIGNGPSVGSIIISCVITSILALTATFLLAKTKSKIVYWV